MDRTGPSRQFAIVRLFIEILSQKLNHPNVFIFLCQIERCPTLFIFQGGVRAVLKEQLYYVLRFGMHYGPMEGSPSIR